MKFEIRQMTLAQSQSAPQDALVLLWPEKAQGHGPVVDWINKARESGDLCSNKIFFKRSIIKYSVL